MNIVEHLLTTMGEEGCEIACECSKMCRFGVHDKNPNDPAGPTNTERLVRELNDLLGVADLLVAQGVLPADWQSREAQAAKQEKVERYWEYARNRGCLQ